MIGDVEPFRPPVVGVGHADHQRVALHRVDRLRHRAGGQVEPVGDIGGTNRRIVGNEVEHLGARQRSALRGHLPVQKPVETEIDAAVAERQGFIIAHNMR